MSNPLVSICIPTYNRASYLGMSLQTILQQDYQPIEVLISDNCSTDRTQDICREAEKKDSRIRYVPQVRNIGMHANHNFLIENSHGEFFCFFHDDDLYTPQIISDNVAFLRAHPEAGVVCSDWGLIDENSQEIGLRRRKVKPITPGLEYIGQTLHSGQSSICCSGALIRRAALGDIRFDPHGSIGFSDFVVWFQIAERYAVGHIPRRLFEYRLHRGAFSRRTIESTSRDYYQTLNQYLDAHLGRWPEHAKMVNRWKGYISRFLFWALVYELGLYFRKDAPASLVRTQHQTVFEMAAYRLTQEEFQQTLKQLQVYQRGCFQSLTLAAIDTLLCLKWTWPLAWVTQYSSLLRKVMGFK